MLSPLHNPEAREALFSELAKKEAEACKHMAEELFKEKEIDSAICAIERAMLKSPNLVDLNSHFSCYVVHKLAAEKKSWYAVLGIRDHGAAVDVIRKRYEAMADLFQPSNCSSVAAESAIKLINEAWRVLSDAKRREAYDMLMGYNDYVVVQPRNQNLENCNKPSILERIRGNSSPAASPSCAHHKTKKVLIIRKNGQNTGDTGNKVVVITRKPAMKN